MYLVRFNSLVSIYPLNDRNFNYVYLMNSVWGVGDLKCSGCHRRIDFCGHLRLILLSQQHTDQAQKPPSQNGSGH